jgi:hypothetical protein
VRESAQCVPSVRGSEQCGQPRISKHLGTLRRARLVSSRREGECVYYETNTQMLAVARDFLDQLEASLRLPHAVDHCADPE